MKIAVKGVIPVLCLFMAMPLLRAQNNNSSTVRTGVVGSTNNTSSSSISVRAKSLYEKEAISPADIPWMRVIYRSLDLKEEKNMPLYYPEESMENQENMFRLIVRLMADGKVPVYEYLDGREIFTEAYQLKVKDVLERYHIPYEEKQGRTSKTVTFGIEDSDIPTNEVLSYYMREKWVFDQRNSKFYPIVEALCPVLHRAGDFGGEAVKYPMFWVRYNDIKPYLSQQYILTNNEINSSDTGYLPNPNTNDIQENSISKQQLWQAPVSFQLKSGDRFRIEGANGSGKTTLLKLITGQLQPQEGTLTQTDFSYVYLNQEYSIIDDRNSILEQAYAFNSRNLPEHEIKIILNRYLFPASEWDKSCRKLSGGEKMRLAFCCLMISNNTPDMFILDEPTNNLDIQSIEIITATIKNYAGTVIAISHDNYFIQEIGVEQCILLS